jgi:3-isopropylmalate dehydrogenase
MMLRHGLDRGADAGRLEAAVEAALGEGLRTADLFTGADGERRVGTVEMTEAVIAAL